VTAPVHRCCAVEDPLHVSPAAPHRHFTPGSRVPSHTSARTPAPFWLLGPKAEIADSTVPRFRRSIAGVSLRTRSMLQRPPGSWVLRYTARERERERESLRGPERERERERERDGALRYTARRPAEGRDRNARILARVPSLVRRSGTLFSGLPHCSCVLRPCPLYGCACPVCMGALVLYVWVRLSSESLPSLLSPQAASRPIRVRSARLDPILACARPDPSQLLFREIRVSRPDPSQLLLGQIRVSRPRPSPFVLIQVRSCLGHLRPPLRVPHVPAILASGRRLLSLSLSLSLSRSLTLSLLSPQVVDSPTTRGSEAQPDRAIVRRRRRCRRPGRRRPAIPPGDHRAAWIRLPRSLLTRSTRAAGPG
jgi:hypothetical protein